MENEVVTLKILTTQIGGLLQRAGSNNEEAIEETARLLAQATIGEGRVIFAGFDEMEAVGLNAMLGAEPFRGAVRYEEGMEIHSADRVWLFTVLQQMRGRLNWRGSLRRSSFLLRSLRARRQRRKMSWLIWRIRIWRPALLKGFCRGKMAVGIVQPHVFVELFLYEAVKMAYDEMVNEED